MLRSYCYDCAGRVSDSIKLDDEKAFEESKDLLATSLIQLEGKKVVKYFDIIAVEIVIGTGIISEFGAALAGRATPFEKKLKKAKEVALLKIKKDAFKIGANAILGVDIDYMNVGNDLLMVIINGTPVIIEN